VGQNAENHPQFTHLQCSCIRQSRHSPWREDTEWIASLRLVDRCQQHFNLPPCLCGSIGIFGLHSALGGRNYHGPECSRLCGRCAVGF